ncbi:VanZ family protein [uncultured Endozoicomonas sp.]|uniref:VanZ family protein n=1 Tax=uncultured Endozoicomonas sp. TaxID=432652 RepID=UPI00262170AF|nr:VanZ family protein [uncultured Endozoicomonas sp.]
MFIFKWMKSLPSPLLKTGFYLLLLAVLVMALLPVEEEGPATLVNDKVMHGLVFLMLAFVMEVLAHPGGELRYLKPALLLLYGALMEVLQGQTGYRDPSIADFIADGVGIAMFYGIASIVRKIEAK